MTQVVAAQIGTQDKVDGAQRALAELGYVDSQVEVFYVTPPGEHGTFPIGGDRDADPGAERAGQGALADGALGAVAGIALGGLAAVAVPLLAPAVFAGVAATGALGGVVVVGGLSEAGRTPEDHGGAGTTSAEQDRSASGAISDDVRDRAEQQAERARTEPGEGTHRSGLMIAVDVGAAGSRADAQADRVIDTLQQCGALPVERVEGQWRDGHWIDFDPLRAMSAPREGAL